ncbi:DUF1800 domain-containing protein [Shimia sp. SDUM112013]|uniref:DUF1800 domain-containing protein n=1 Tax=Shimia sp. SDUM112013 TaxID=3136160 RepID=UPI0032EE58E9
MRFDPVLAEIRFGYGLSPDLTPPSGVAEMLAGLIGPDDIITRFPIPSMDSFREDLLAYRAANRTVRKSTDKAEAEEASKITKSLGRDFYRQRVRITGQTLMRQVNSPTAFRERLVSFWKDHFTVRGKSVNFQALVGSYVDEAIRPFVAGRFEEMLIAVVMHPMMLMYLDQTQSIGPNSAFARQKNKAQGLNENLAREVLELHTLGVDGPYTQADVRELAELLTGLAFWLKTGFRYLPNRAEPGPETILGQSYGQRNGRLQDIEAALRDLARHPATARHIAGKLAVHFLSDTPDPALVERLTGVYLDTQGDLLAVYQALLEAPGAWDPVLANIKPPQDFMASAMRGLGVTGSIYTALGHKGQQRLVVTPLHRMGQPWDAPGGPDGWPEQDEAWISPQGMAARLQWALTFPSGVLGAPPDPREFVRACLGPDAPQDVAFAAEAAENRREGVALVLMSPAFQRR